MPYGQDPPVAGAGSGYGKDPAQSGKAQQPPAQQPGAIETFLHGVSTGLAGDVVGAGQLAGSVLPSAITDPIAHSTLGQALTREANRPTPGFSGVAGNLVGAGLPFLIQPELGITRAVRAAPYVGRGLEWLWNAFRTGTLPAALQPAPNQTERAKQALIGTGVGGTLHTLGEGAGRVLSRWTGQRAANRAAQQAHDTAQAAADRTRSINEGIDISNQGRRQARQQDIATREQQTYQQKVADQQAKAARDAVPAAHTQDWWREALRPIGEEARAPRSVSPQGSAQVRRIIGDRLNTIRDRMNLNPNDTGFRQEINGIRDEIDSQIRNQSTRDQWSHLPEQKFDPDGNLLPPTKQDEAKINSSIWGKYVEQPLAETQNLTGRELTNYVSSLSDLAEEYGRRAARAPEADRPELLAIANGLRRVVDAVDKRGVGGDGALAKELTAAKRSYNLWSIGNDSVDPKGVMTPRKTMSVWRRRQGGQANYGAEMEPGHPRFHPENARIKGKLQTALDAHETKPPTRAPQAPLPLLTTRSRLPIPHVPPAPTEDARLPGAVSHGIGHAVTALTGSPTAGRVARGIAHYGGRGAARPVLGATRGVGRAAAPLAAGSAKIPEIVVTAPRYRPGEDQEKR